MAGSGPAQAWGSGALAEADFRRWTEQLEHQLSLVERRLALERRRGDLLRIQNDLLRHRLLQQGQQRRECLWSPAEEDPEQDDLRLRLDRLEAARQEAERRAAALEDRARADGPDGVAPQGLRGRLARLEAARREAERRAEALEEQARGACPGSASRPLGGQEGGRTLVLDGPSRRLAELEVARREAERRAEALEEQALEDGYAAARAACRACPLPSAERRLEALDAQRLQAERHAQELERRLGALERGAAAPAGGAAGAAAAAPRAAAGPAASSGAGGGRSPEEAALGRSVSWEFSEGDPG